MTGCRGIHCRQDTLTGIASTDQPYYCQMIDCTCMTGSSFSTTATNILYIATWIKSNNVISTGGLHRRWKTNGFSMTSSVIRYCPRAPVPLWHWLKFQEIRAVVEIVVLPRAHFRFCRVEKLLVLVELRRVDSSWIKFASFCVKLTWLLLKLATIRCNEGVGCWGSGAALSSSSSEWSSSISDLLQELDPIVPHQSTGWALTATS